MITLEPKTNMDRRILNERIQTKTNTHKLDVKKDNIRNSYSLKTIGKEVKTE